LGNIGHRNEEEAEGAGNTPISAVLPILLKKLPDDRILPAGKFLAFI